MKNNNDILAKLTLGKDKTEDVVIEYEGEKTTITLRPLTSGELSKLQSIEKQPFHVKIGMTNGKRTTTQTNMQDMDINTAEFTEAQNEAMYTAIAWSMNIKPEQVKEFYPGVPELIFEQIIRVSKLSDDDLTVIKQFRKD